MPNQQSIDQIVDSKAIAQVKEAEAALTALEKKLVDSIVGANKLNSVLGGSSSLKDYNSNLAKSQLAQERIAKAAAATQLAEERLSVFRANEYRKEENRMERLRIAKERANSKNDFSYYKQLENQYKLVSSNAQDLGAQLLQLQKAFGKNPAQGEIQLMKALSISFDDASKEASQLQKELAGIDSKIGKWNRNVGNYKSGFNGLGNSINQITRELPAFSLSAQTGFLAISNNLPILFDEINRTKNEISALRAEGQKVPGLFSQLTKSIFSWGTALSLGVTLLTLFGKDLVDWIATLFKGTKAMDYFAERQKVMNEVRRNGFKYAQTELVNLNNLYRATQNASLSMNERKKAVDELQKQYPETFKNLKDEEILVGKAGKAHEFLTKQILAEAFTQAASAKIAENRLREYDNEQRRIEARIKIKKEEAIIDQTRERLLNARGSAGTGSSNQQGFADQMARSEARLADQNKIIREANVDSAELSKRNAALIADIDKQVELFGVRALGVRDDGKSDKVNTDEIDLLIQRAKNRADDLKDIAENEQKALDIRLDAARKLGPALEQIAKLNSQKDLMEADITSARKVAINEQKNYEIRKADTESSELIYKINSDANNKLKSIFNQGVKDYTDAEKLKIQAVFDSQNEILELQEEERATQVAKQSELYAQGKIDRRQYEEALRNIESNARRDSLQEQIDNLEKVIKIQEDDLAFGIGSQKELSDNQRKLSKFRVALSQLESDEKIRIKERELEEIAKIQQSEKQLAQDVFDFGRQLTNQIFDNRIGKLELEKERLDANTQNEIKNVQQSVATEEEKKKQIAIIEAKAANDQLAIDERIRNEKRKQAIADKAAAVAQAVINIALAQTKTLAATGFLGIPLNAVVAAIGAVQIASILATPIPKFAKGTESSPEGLAYVGERGRELRINPDGTSEFTPSSATLTYLQKGTKIIPNHDLQRMMAKPPKIGGSDSAGKSWDLMPLLASNSRIEKAVGKIAVKSTHITEKGWYSTQGRMKSYSDYVKRNFS